MQHLGQLVKEWRGLSRTLRKQQMAEGGEGDASIEPEWRFGTLTQTGFVAGIAAADFQTLAKKLMALYQQPPLSASASAGEAKRGETKGQSNADLKGGEAKGGGKAGALGQVVRVEEWHLEDVMYEGGFRARQAKLASSLPQPLASAPQSTSEFIQKQRVAWSDMRVLQRKYDGRFALKCERSVSQSVMANLNPEQRRMQTRRSFWIENYLKIELSIVQQQSLNQSSSGKGPSVRYEVEMEIIPEGALALSDQQIVHHIWNWALEILDSFGKLQASESVDGPLLVLRLKPEDNHKLQSNPTDQRSAAQRAVAADVLLVPTARDIARAAVPQ